MSLDTWKAEFYPQDVTEIDLGDDLVAVNHSLLKWEGLTPENLEKHGLVLSADLGWSNSIVERVHTGERFLLAFESCALCQQPRREIDDCVSCPLSIARGNVSCDDARNDESKSPWSKMIRDKSPYEMIHWLKITKEYIEADRGLN